jgi:hypothetical protein
VDIFQLKDGIIRSPVPKLVICSAPASAQQENGWPGLGFFVRKKRIGPGGGVKFAACGETLACCAGSRRFSSGKSARLRVLEDFGLSRDSVDWRNFSTEFGSD